MMKFLLDNDGVSIDIDELLVIIKQAGAGIMKIYEKANGDFGVSYKEDRSPLTLADSASHKIIAEDLANLYPGIPLLSEEGKEIPFEERSNWQYYWCVDPLDGTKEFIKRNGEFTVNIALVCQNSPVLGIIYIPVTDTLYFGGRNIGCWRKAGDGKIDSLKQPPKAEEWTAVASRTHSSEEEEAIFTKYNVKHTISAGSSLKFCMVAEGNAQIYYRHGPTMEWDTAAGHAIAVSSGAFMAKPNGEPFTYNKPNLLNSSFICSISPIIAGHNN